MKYPAIHGSLTAQRGAVMIVSMILLLVMTVLALGGSHMTRLQERMASGTRNQDLAMQSAEAGLRAGERVVAAFVSPPTACNAALCGQVYEVGFMRQTLGVSYEDQAYRDRTWWATVARPYSVEQVISGDGVASAEPMFYVEELEEVPDQLSSPPTGPPPSRIYYRITSLGQGGTDAAQVALQSTFARRFN